MAFAVAWSVTIPVMRHAHTLGLLDRPNQRSSHVRATPRGGGLGIIAGVIAGLCVVQWFVEPVSWRVWAVFSAACLVAVAGLFDDVRELSPLARLAAQFVAGALVLSATGPIMYLPPPLEHVPLWPVFGMGLSLLWITAVTNFFNFMDGFDGLASSQAVASCVGVLIAGWAPDASLIALVIGAACSGFLLHNWTPARVFMGDVGSGFLGFTLAILPLLAPPVERSAAVLATAVGLSLFLLDPALTLVRRAWRRKPLTESHREHLYQQFAAPGEPVGRVVALYAVLAVLQASAAGMSYRRPELLTGIALVSVIAFAVVCIFALRAEGHRQTSGR
jgi:UDP-N-acetylmuramyl pentapeptide phosphotransferase/UDP-N-acetylglucosamine-1-phosphate transferase